MLCINWWEAKSRSKKEMMKQSEYRIWNIVSGNLVEKEVGEIGLWLEGDKGSTKGENVFANIQKVERDTKMGEGLKT